MIERNGERKTINVMCLQEKHPISQCLKSLNRETFFLALESSSEEIGSVQGRYSPLIMLWPFVEMAS